VKIIHDNFSEDGKDCRRTMPVRISQFALGDRDNGEVRLDRTKLFVGKSRYRFAPRMRLSSWNDWRQQL
jgi:hypothetical protein